MKDVRYMNSKDKWYTFPNMTDTWGNNNNYIMFIDENNSISSINIVKRKILNNEKISPNENIFTVTGCIFSHNDYYDASSKFKDLKNKYWNNGKYFDEKKKKYYPVCFHSEDIRGRKKAFHNTVLNDAQYNKFIIDLDNILKVCKYKIISININLKEYLLNPYNVETNVYKVAFNFIIERFIYNMRNFNKGVIIFEARGKKEDKLLLEHIDMIINHKGTEFISNKELSEKINGVYFNKKISPRGNTYTGLEIADLSSYPIHRYIKFGTIGRDLATIKLKIVGYPNCMGKGLKIYPKKIETGFVPLSTDHECDPITELEEISVQ